MRLNGRSSEGRPGVKSRDVLIEQDFAQEPLFDLDHELSGENLEKFKQALRNEVNNLSTTENDVVMYSQAVRRCRVIQCLPVDKQHQFEELRVLARDKILAMLTVPNSPLFIQRTEGRVVDLIQAFPDAREKILATCPHLKKPHLDMEHIHDAGYSARISEAIVQTLTIWPEDMEDLRELLRPYVGEINQILSQDRHALTAVPDAAILGCAFPELRSELKDLAKSLVKEESPAKLNVPGKEIAYVNYIYHLAILAAPAISITPQGRIILQHEPVSLAGSKPLPPRQLV